MFMFNIGNNGFGSYQEITTPMKENEELVRPWSSLKTLRGAKGKSIAWPSVFVCFFSIQFSILKHMCFFCFGDMSYIIII